jgi:polyribonucleotide nucleotidyltransferase
MADQHPCKTCGHRVSTEAHVCPNCGQPEPVPPITERLAVGKIYTGRVTSITSFGAFVEIAPGVEGLLHISEIRDEPVKRVEDVISKGDSIEVKLLEIGHSGRIKLSHKAL